MAYQETKYSSDNLKYFFNFSSSVGPSRPNSKADAALVQALLRNCYDTGDIAKLKVNGDCGPQARASPENLPFRANIPAYLRVELMKTKG